MELEMDCLTSRKPFQKVCSYECQFCTKVCAYSSLVFQVHMMAGQNIKKKYLMCQSPIKMWKQHAIPNSNLHDLKKDLFTKRLQKNYSKMNDYKCTYEYLANTAILNIRIFSRRYHFRLWFFASTSE